MNAYEAAKRMYSISEELAILSKELGQTQKPEERNRVEQSINILEVEFFRLKHTMEKKQISTY